MSKLSDRIQNEMKDPEFAKAWEETEIEDQVKRLIIESRIHKNMTQTQLSLKSGIRQSNISRIESGMCSPSIKTLCRLAQACGKKLSIRFEDEVLLPKKMNVAK